MQYVMLLDQQQHTQSICQQRPSLRLVYSSYLPNPDLPFWSRGCTSALLKSVGKVPRVIQLLTMTVSSWLTDGKIFFSKEVGIGSNSQLFVGLVMMYHSWSLHDIGLNSVKDVGVGVGVLPPYMFLK